MLNESLFFLSLNELKTTFFELTIYHMALVYILTYVIYKALGRYIYFKPQEHASKINRTFLSLALLVVVLGTFSRFIDFVIILPEYRWLYIGSGLILFVAPLSILANRIIWKHEKYGRSKRDWCYHYLPIHDDYYKTSVSKREQDGNTISSWEEEGVESTEENIHSDALLNVLALIVFLIVGGCWSYESTLSYGWLSIAFFVGIIIPVASIFIDRAIFSWIEYIQEKR